MKKNRQEKEKKQEETISAQGGTLCQTVHQVDIPEPIDKFGNSHVRIADAIATLIKTTKNGHTIGVEGSWGSGKSTIIQLLKKTFSEASSSHIFVFDAWAHEGDPLRRVFLQKLISEFPSSIVNEKDKSRFKTKIDNLAGPQQNSSGGKKEGIPWIIFFLFFSLLPLGFDLVISEYQNITLMPGEIDIPFVIGSGIIVGFIISFLYVIIQFFASRDTNRIVFFQITPQPSPESLTFNPTSIDFERCFREFTTSVFKNGLSRLIIVIDNIDRIDSENSRKLLSTLQTFIDKDNKVDPNDDKIWIIIPYDLQSLLRIWGHAPGENDQEFAKSFFNKRFQTVFHVPQPIFSKAKSFFIEKFLNAFPNDIHTKRQANAIFSIISYHAKKNGFVLNPREIIKFINQLGVYHITWQDSISLEDISEFICSIDLCKEINKRSVLNTFVVGNEISSDLKNSFLSLFYCQPKTTAYQVHFDSLYSSFIEESKFDEIQKYYDLDPDGFWAVLSDASFLHIARIEVFSNLCHFSKLLNSLTDDGCSRESVQNRILDSFSNIDDFSTIKQTNIEDMLSVLQSASASKFQKLLAKISNITYLAEKLSTPTFDNNEIKILEEWYKCVSRIIDVAYPKISNGKIKIASSLNASGSLELLMVMMRSPNFEKNVPFFNFSTLDASFAQAIIDRINNNTLEEEAALIPIISGLAGIYIDWSSISTAIETKLLANDSHPEQVEIIIPLLLNLSEKSINTTLILNQFTQHTKLFSLIGTPETNEFQTAWLIFIFCFYSVSPAIPGSFPTSTAMNGKTRLVDILNNPSNSPNIMAHLSALVLTNLTPGDCLTSSSKQLLSSIMTEILKLSFTDEKFAKQLTKDDIFSHWKLIKNTSSPDVYETILSTRENLIEHVLMQPFDENYIDFYKDLVVFQKPKYVKILYSWLTDHFIKKTEPEWVQVFQSNETISNFIAFLNMGQNRLVLNTNFISGLEETCQLIIDQGQSFPLLESKWEFIKLSYPNHDLFIVSLINVMQMAMNSPKPISPEILKLLGSDFLDKEVLTSSTEIIPKVFKKIVESNDEYALTWLLSVFTTFPSLLSYFGKKIDISDLKYRIFEKSDENASNPNNIYQKIIMATRWKRQKPKTIN